MSGEVEIGRFRREDEAAAIGLLVSKLPPKLRDRATAGRTSRWRWQYYENPLNPDGEPVIWVARVGGQMAGFIGVLPVRLRTAEGLVEACWGMDLMVDPTFRGLGIGKKLVLAWRDTYGVSLGKGWSRAAHSIETGLGFKTLTGFNSYVFILSRPRFVSHCLRSKDYKGLMRAGRVLYRRHASGWRPADTPGGREITVTEGVPGDIGELWSRVSAHYDFAVERDIEYLKWRYISHPLHEYRFVCVRDGGRLKACAVARGPHGDSPTGAITELLAEPGDAEWGALALRAALGFAKESGAATAVMDPPPALAELASRARCPHLTDSAGIIVHSRAPGGQAGICDSARWYLSRGDSDTDF